MAGISGGAVTKIKCTFIPHVQVINAHVGESGVITAEVVQTYYLPANGGEPIEWKSKVKVVADNDGKVRKFEGLF